MIVVADTSSLNYLIQIDCDILLPKIYGHIIVPAGVIEELSHAGAPAAVRLWLTRLPSWVDVHVTASPPDSKLAFLGLVEREAIQLAEEQHADLLLIDERQGRLEAKRRGLMTTGTLGVLLSAGELGLVDSEVAYRRLIAETSFRTSAALEAQFLGRIGPAF
jgi:predicted nucleic acid-binding protein